jgi:hypothetical protein
MELEYNFPAQGSAEWFAQRRGLFTGSALSPLCAPEGIGKGGMTYIMQKIAEKYTQPEFDVLFSSKETQWGDDNEALLFKVHGKRSKSIIEEVGFQVHPELEYLGASPDRKVHRDGKIGIGEGKCPYAPENHIKHCLIDSVEYFKKNHKDFYWQTVTEFVCTPDAEFVDFISFDPRMDKTHGYFCFTFVPPIEDQQFLIERVKQAHQIMTDIENKLTKNIKTG